MVAGQRQYGVDAEGGGGQDIAHNRHPAAVPAGDLQNRLHPRLLEIRVPIMAGIIPLKSAGMARFMNENVPGIAVPEEI